MAIPSPSQFAKMPVENVSRLSITLRLPFGFFQSVEQLSSNDSTSLDTDLATQQASLWQRLGSSLSRFKALEKLDLWLDHTEPQFWAVVNERSTLDPLLTQLSGRPDLDVTVTLPMLHPKFEQDERHYIDEEISPNVRVHRVLRQKKSDTTHFWNALAERDHKHAQAITQLRQAAEHQSADYAATLKVLDQEIHLLRQERVSLKEGIEDMEFEIVPVNDDVARLRAENAKLRRAAIRRTREIKGLHDKIKDCNKSFGGYKKRVKALANEH
ncbi:hypothetical protein BKA58DRAFT_446212 [Alternaria rosae]|uniref:uncharacterized protein n=1 Tax=Alternaria rosae TaxID=1187941 RepID=UPI001E8E3641|nr:uncharacterized protein BKA58DRAFT_446212 [Alternaria rosae]KAH6881933.1 hypothetical protein BKA58DRAFT_446212 [Alternaria rosae]